MTKTIRNTLARPLVFKLAAWLQANHAQLLSTRATQNDAAQRAATELGFPVSAGNIHGVTSDLGLEPFWPLKGTPAANGAVDALARRVAHLEDVIDRLMLGFINQDSKAALNKLRDAHQKFVIDTRGDES